VKILISLFMAALSQCQKTGYRFSAKALTKP
jgi:hypothetical protein